MRIDATRDPLVRSAAARLGASVAACVILSGAAGAQTGSEGSVKRAWSIVPRVSATQTFTDNVELNATSRQSDQITEISPGVRMQADTARLKAYVDYSLRNYVSAQDSRRNRMQNALTSFGTFEAVDKWLYVEANASISQQTISAFGPQSAGTGTFNSNSTQAATYRISPYVRGRLAGTADYLVRYSHAETRTASLLTTNSVSEELTARVNGVLTGPLSWSLDASHQSSKFGSGINNTSDRFTGRISYRYSPELNAFLSAGTDTNNYTSGARQSFATHGYGMEWTPSERTAVNVSRERRFFGHSHSISVSHRMPRAALRFSDSKSVSVTPGQAPPASQGTYYDLLYAQLAATVPDPVQRAQQVTTLLQQAGIAPTAAITGGYLSSRVSVLRRQELSFVLNGLRNTVTYTLFQTAAESAGAAAALLADDFSRTSQIRTSGMSSNLSHRLSSQVSLNALTSFTQSSGSNGGIKTTQRVMNLNVAAKLSQRTSLSLGIRGTVSDGASSYRENAMLGTLVTQF